MGNKLETGRAPSGAASTSHSPFSSSNSSLLPTGPSGTGSGWSAGAGDTGKGGDPKTDHSLRVSASLGGDSPHLGGWQPKLPPDSPACTVLAVSRAHYSKHADGFSTTDFPAVRDGFPSFLKVAMVCRGQEIPFTRDQNT